jgi:hypothetical protein
MDPMAAQGRRWAVQDRDGNEIYLTEERWAHITERHPEMLPHEDPLRETIRSGQRRQDALNPQKFRYSKEFSGLSEANTHVVAIVLFRFAEDEDGRPRPNNYVTTAYQKSLR